MYDEWKTIREGGGSTTEGCKKKELWLNAKSIGKQFPIFKRIITAIFARASLKSHISNL